MNLTNRIAALEAAAKRRAMSMEVVLARQSAKPDFRETYGAYMRLMVARSEASWLRQNEDEQRKVIADVESAEDAYGAAIEKSGELRDTDIARQSQAILASVMAPSAVYGATA